MTTIHEAYINALLADATYALTINRPNGYSSDELKNLLELNNRMTPTLANYIGNNFTVVTHIDSDDISGSGFDATVWRRNDGKAYVSMTGTEGLQDFLTDTDLAVSSGAARAQIAEMVNWWLKISTPATAMAAQITLVPVFDNSVPPQITTYDFQSAAPVQGLGLLNGVTSIELNGHSLGGHLASAFARLFGASANSTGSGKITIDNITTFNSAGFNGSSHFVFEDIESLIGVGLGRLPNSTEQTNYFAENGLNVTTNSFFSSQVGQRLEISNEESTGIPNHFMYKLTDALALGDAIAKLDSSFDTNKMNALLDKGANQTIASLEGILDGFRKTLLGNGVTTTPIGDVGDSQSSRTTYYSNLKALTDSAAFISLIGKVQLVAPPTSASSASEARADFGVFLSMVNLTPFALKTTTAEASTALKNANVLLSTTWTADNALTAEQRANGAANFSDMYLNDRATMLGWLIKRNQADETGPIDGPAILFQDINTNTVIRLTGSAFTNDPDRRHFIFGSDIGPINADALDGGNNGDHLYGLGGNDTLNGLAGNDYLEGGEGSDTLKGDEGQDVLLGGTGNDILDGGIGNDQLKGGTGVDVYQLSGTYGTDIITDTDGVGMITIDSTPLTGGTYKLESVYKHDGTGYTYTQVNGGNTLIISKADNPNRIIINDWSATKNLSITLDGQASASPTATLSGDFKKKIDGRGTTDTNDDIYLKDAQSGNYLADGPEVGAADIINGSGGDDVIKGLQGNDLLMGHNGNDYIEGGDGVDILSGGSGRDTLIGGAGDDWIYGTNDSQYTGPGNVNSPDISPAMVPGYPTLVGRGFSWFISHPAQPDSDGFYPGLVKYWGNSGANDITGNSNVQKNDQAKLIEGGQGNDVILAGTGSDIVHGGADNDKVFGHTGDDILFGDGGSDRIYGDYLISSDFLSADHGKDIIDGGNGDDFLLGQGKDDIIFGGNDNDKIWGDDKSTTLLDPEYNGADYLDGGDGNDQITGGGKDDTLIGGIGNDTLWGDDTEANLAKQYHGNDYLYGGAGTDGLYAGSGNDYLDGGAGIDTLNGEDGDDILLGSGEGDLLVGGAGSDTFYAGAGDKIADGGKGDHIIIAGTAIASNASVQLNAADSPTALLLQIGNGQTIKLGDGFVATGNATYTFADGSQISHSDLLGNTLNSVVAGATEAEMFFGGMLNDQLQAIGSTNSTLFGGLGDDTLLGNLGNNTLDGGVGNDTMLGGAGNDTYTFDLGSGHDVIDNFDAQSLVANLDTIQFGSGIDQSNVSIEQFGQDLLIRINPSITSNDLIQIKNYFQSDSTTSSAISNIKFGNGDVWDIATVRRKLGLGTISSDVMQGYDTADNMNGFEGDDLLYGNGGDDYLFGNFGDDTLDGGSGNDTLQGGAGYSADGNETYIFGKGYGQDEIRNERSLGTIDTLKFNSSVNASEVLVGASGSNGTNLVFYIAGTTDKITIQSYLFRGYDVNGNSVNYGWDSYWNKVDNVEFNDGAVWTQEILKAKLFEGTPYDDNIMGDSLSNLIHGGAGNDNIYSGGGNDTLFGGDGDDIVDGRGYAGIIGSNVLYGDAGNDTLESGHGNDTLYGGDGNDLLQSNNGNSYMYGGNGNDSIAGAGLQGNETLVGGAGSDTLAGGDGSDTYIFTTGDGSDYLMDYKDSGETNIVEFTNVASTALIGVYRRYDDLVIKYGANDYISVSYSFDSPGFEISQFRFSNDVTLTTADLLALFPIDNTPPIFSSISYTLSQNEKDLTLTDYESINGTGNALDNIINGNPLDNILDGGAGDDLLIGGWGDDVYIVDSIRDVVYEYESRGTDTVKSSVTFSLLNDYFLGQTIYNHIENLTLTGTDAIDAYGNNLNNTFKGNIAANSFYGAGGIDTYLFAKGDGQDVVYIQNNGSTIRFTDARSDEVIFSRQNGNLVLKYGNLDQITIKTQYAWDYGREISKFTFSDGKTWTAETVDAIISGEAYGVPSSATPIVSQVATEDTLFNFVVSSNSFNPGNSNFLSYYFTLEDGSQLPYWLTYDDSTLTLSGTPENGDVGSLNLKLIATDSDGDSASQNFSLNVINSNDAPLEIDTIGSQLGFENTNFTFNASNFFEDVDKNDTLTYAISQSGGSPLPGWLTINPQTGVLSGVPSASNIGNLSLKLIVTDIAGASVNATFGLQIYALPNQSLMGTSENDTLRGGSGNDTLDGLGGADMLIGSFGNDLYYVDNVGDVVMENSTAGTDTVQSSVSYTISSNVEKLILTGATNIDGTGNASANTITGNSGNNRLDGADGSDIMIGGDGNDTYVVNVAGDAITENENQGIDTVESSVTFTLNSYAYIENLTLTGNSAINATGNSLDNVLKGNSAANLINGGTGADTMIGKNGNDTYTVDNINDVVTEVDAEGLDLVNVNIANVGGTYQVTSYVENATLTSAVAYNLTGNDLVNTLTGNAASNILDGGAGADILKGGAGDDTYIIDLTSTNTLQDSITELSSGGIDTLVLRGGAILGSATPITLGAEIEKLDASNTGTTLLTLNGNSLINTITGNAANNSISGGAGADILIGGLGDDTYIVDSGDTVTEYESGGTDTISSGITWTLDNPGLAYVENLTLTGTTAINGTGNALHNKLKGNSSINTLIGNDGNDTLDGGTSADILKGGNGDDLYIVDNAGDAITENSGQGTDTIESSVTLSLATTANANVENLTLTGTAVNATGNALGNVLIGNTGNNTLTGNTGNDLLYGGDGSDTYVINTGDGHDKVYETSQSGTDVDILNIKVASSTVTLQRNLNNLVLVYGSDSTTLVDWYTPTGNTIEQVKFNDITWSKATLQSLAPASNNAPTVATPIPATQTNEDTQFNLNITSSFHDDVGDQLTYTASQQNGDLLPGWLNFNSSTGIFSGTPSNSDVGNFNVKVTATDTSGAAVNQTFSLTVNNTNDAPLLNGTVSTQQLVDGTSYSFALPSTLFQDIDAGDQLSYSLTQSNGSVLPSWLSFDAQTRVLSGLPNALNIGSSYTLRATATDLAGATVSTTFTLNVNAMPDQSITGDGDNNSLSSGSGNDTLDGGVGADTLAGGYGNDTYIADNAADVVNEVAGQGNDTVQSSVTYILGASTSVENLILTGTAVINATGNTLDNTLTGNTANNTLNGAAGADIMQGGQGNDTYVVDNASDVVIENVNEGTTDLIQTSITLPTLAANVENLTLTGTAAINGTGNDLNNNMIGNNAANTLRGGIGDDTLNGGGNTDTMIGGVGNDTYTVEVSTDVVTEALNEGTDQVNVAMATLGGSYLLAANIENATLINTIAFSLNGNALDNSLTGNSAANTLNGGDGNDTLRGGSGADTLNGGAGSDTVTYSLTWTGVQINLATGTAAGGEAAGDVLVGIENITGSGTNDILIGDAGNNVLDGSQGSDQLTGGLGNDTYVLDGTGDTIVESADEGIDTVKAYFSHTLGANLENFILTGTGSGQSGNGNELNNMLIGNVSTNSLNGHVGNDILQGMAGADSLTDIYGNNLLDGGLDNDTLVAGAGRDLLLGGKGNDTITTGTGYDIISFNKGDGQDTVNATNDINLNTLSLGGNFAYSDLSLSKTANNLILKMGTTDQITLKDWYADVANKSVVNLQVIAEAIQGFSLGSADVLRNNKVENFNFANLVTAFDTSGTAAGTNWQLTDAILNAHLNGGSDTAAVGGDLAYQYGINSNLTGVGLIASQNVINASTFGQSAQTLNNPTTWQSEAIKLG